MAHIIWNEEEFSTGINVIDAQHKRIIHYINQLSDAQELNMPDLVGTVLIELVDYTLSHFAFEESLMEDADYSAIEIHKQTHGAFCKKIESYEKKYKEGGDITEELFQILNIWLLNHIAEDDRSYAPTVIKKINGINTSVKQSWLKTRVKQFFK